MPVRTPLARSRPSLSVRLSRSLGGSPAAGGALPSAHSSHPTEAANRHDARGLRRLLQGAQGHLKKDHKAHGTVTAWWWGEGQMKTFSLLMTKTKTKNEK